MINIPAKSKEQAALYQFLLQQVAAESYLETSGTWRGDDQTRALLDRGANRRIEPDPGRQPGHTRLTQQQAKEFTDNYTIVHQWSDNPTTSDGAPVSRPLILNDGTRIESNTGFSATLIRNTATGEYTFSIRSTEFKHWENFGDRERDVGLADTVEMAAVGGFAYAQIDAMRYYYQWLKEKALLPTGAKVNVTGYSLGGHLATVFGELYTSDVNRVVTFNAPGRGEWNGNPTEVMDYFRQQLKNPTNELSSLSMWAELLTIKAAVAALGPPDTVVSVLNAYSHAKEMADTNAPIDPVLISRDPRYIWALAATSVRFNHSHLPMSNEWQTGTNIDNLITAVFGYEGQFSDNWLTNVTAASGIHGPTLRVGIESQPTVEGLFTDFGSGHSITLLGDSLALQRTLLRVDKNLDNLSFIEASKSATNVKTKNSYSWLDPTFRYEHDLLENILDGARYLFLGPNQTKTESIPGVSPTYNERSGFGDMAMRDKYFANLGTLENSAAYKAMADKMSLRVGGLALGNSARTNFADFAALYKLSPVYLGYADGVGDVAALNGTFAAPWGAVYTRWQLDANTVKDGLTATQPLTYSDIWLEKRAEFLNAIAVRNAGKQDSDAVSGVGVAKDYTWRDAASNQEVASKSSIPFFSKRRYVVFGASAQDTLGGGSEGDFLFGGDGSDALDGAAGGDYVEGNDGADVLGGGTGNDTLLGGEGIDQLSGGDDHDLLQGDTGNDVLNGGAGNDLLLGGAGNDELRGDAGNDFLNGGAGFDTLKGGGDNDILFDQGGSDTNYLWGEAGNDQLEVKGGTGAFFLDGGSGNDVLRGSSQGGSALTGGTGNDWLRGGDAYDILVGDGGVADAGGGAPGADLIEAGKGNDLITGGGGADLLRGGEGNDTYRYTDRKDFGTDLIEDSLGTNIIEMQGLSLGTATYSADKLAWVTGTGIEIRKIDAGGSTLLAISNPLDANSTLYIRNWAAGQYDFTLSGGPVARVKPGATPNTAAVRPEPNNVNLLRGEASDGGAGNDILIGGESSSLLLGGVGNDLLDGRGGDDDDGSVVAGNARRTLGTRNWIARAASNRAHFRHWA